MTESENFDTRNSVQLSIAKQFTADVMWTHKVHEKQAEIYFGYHECLYWIDVCLSFVTACGVFALARNLLPCYQWLIELLSIITSVLATGFAIFIKHCDFCNQARQHKSAAVRFLGIRNRLYQIVGDFRSGNRPIEDIRAEFAQIRETTQALYELVPQTTPKALAKAETALKTKKESSYSQEELNALLPEYLR